LWEGARGRGAAPAGATTFPPGDEEGGVVREIRRRAAEIRLAGRSRAQTPPPAPSHKGRGNSESEGAARKNCGTDASGPVHRLSIRVYYEDTDAAGIVYYANYLKFAERARSEWLRELGADAAQALKASGTVFVVRRCEIDYLQPARLDDVVVVETRVVGSVGATLDLRQIVRRGAIDLVAMNVTLACLNAARRPARLPAALRAALATVC
jgi:acyl-CoA thioester hydrolase